MQTGTRQYKLMLSERRANAVRDYLMEKGIAAERIKAEGRGDREQQKDTMRENRVAICVAEGK
jgi:outer membrane protein OmpA-like peptidoglycan-associated protein